MHYADTRLRHDLTVWPVSSVRRVSHPELGRGGDSQCRTLADSTLGPLLRAGSGGSCRGRRVPRAKFARRPTLAISAIAVTAKIQNGGGRASLVDSRAGWPDCAPRRVGSCRSSQALLGVKLTRPTSCLSFFGQLCTRLHLLPSGRPGRFNASELAELASMSPSYWERTSAWRHAQDARSGA